MRKEEFKIICINDTNGITGKLLVKRLSIFYINIYEYNREGPKSNYLRLTIRNQTDLYYRRDFMKLSDYRNQQIGQILDS